MEVFVPSTGQQCELPDLPGGRYYHTMENMTVYGGWDSGDEEVTSCLTLTADGTWERTATLEEER